MNAYDGIHWNINQILPYQRNFNFINGPRSIGKTYTTQKYMLDKCLNSDIEFVYIVRTQDEKKHYALQDAFKKVTSKEFSNYSFRYDSEYMYVCIESNNKIIAKRIIGYCIALSEAQKIKTKSYPKVKYILFDEYMVEESSGNKYINGWKEPELLLSIYHTIDREEDRVVVFAMGNNTKFHNPYHMHPAFNIKPVGPGKISLSKNTLFQNAQTPKELKLLKDKSEFIQMINNTEYGSYAKDGEYYLDDYNFIREIKVPTRYSFTIIYDGEKYGVYSSQSEGLIYISDKIDPSCYFVYALTLSDHSENTMLTKGMQSSHLKWLAKNYKLGNVRYINMRVKTKIEKGIYLLL